MRSKLFKLRCSMPEIFYKVSDIFLNWKNMFYICILYFRSRDRHQQKFINVDMDHRYRSSILYHKDQKKQGDLRDCFVLQTVTLFWHVAQWISRAPPHHILPAFLNLNGSWNFTACFGFQTNAGFHPYLWKYVLPIPNSGREFYFQQI